MKFNTKSPLVLLCLIFTVITLFSCSKDSDLMADYVALDPDIGTIARFVANDSYLISISDNPEDDTFEIIVNNTESSETSASGSNGTTVNDSYQISSDVSIILDVLANDTFENKEEISIIETSQPNNGNVVINEDNTLTYTPEEILTTEPVTDTFTYTAEVQNTDGTVTSGEADVNIIIEVADNASRQDAVVNISSWGYCQDGNPIGGGAGYDAIVTTGTHIVSTNLSASAFKTLVQARTSGDVVFINSDVAIDLTALGAGYIAVPGGVTIASDRGNGANLGALLFTNEIKYQGTGSERPVFITTGPNVRFTGFRFQGPYGGEGIWSLDNYDLRRKFGIASNYNNTEIDNMELYNWPFAAVTFSGYGGGDFFGPNQFSDGHLYHHNYAHNNRQNRFGYGVNVQHADAKIYANRFAYNRHDIAGGGHTSPDYTGYEAYCNTHEGDNISHNVDMHGNLGNVPGTIAGKYAYIHHNDFEDVGVDRSTNTGTNNENIRISGNPEENVTIVNNRFAHPNIGIAYKILYLTTPANEVVNNNTFN